MSQEELSRITIGAMVAPSLEELVSDSVLIEVEPVKKNLFSIEIRLEGDNFWQVLAVGFEGSTASSNIMSCVEMTKLVDRYGEFQLSAVMKIGDLRSACTLTISESQLLNIIKLGLSKIMGGNVESVQLRSYYTYICEYNLTVNYERTV